MEASAESETPETKTKARQTQLCQSPRAAASSSVAPLFEIVPMPGSKSTASTRVRSAAERQATQFLSDEQRDAEAIAEREGWAWAEACLSDETDDAAWLEKALAEQKRRGLAKLGMIGGIAAGSLLAVAAAEGDAPAVRLLLDWHNVDAQDARGRTALLEAVRAGSLECVKLLAERADLRAVVGKEDPGMLGVGAPILHHAARMGNAEIVAFLASVCDPAQKEELTRKIALHVAAEWSDEDVVRALLAVSDANARDDSGQNALGCALHNDKPRVLKALLDAGASCVNGPLGRTAAMEATHLCACECLPLLLTKHDWQVSDKLGNDIFDYVAARGAEWRAKLSPIVEAAAPMSAGWDALSKHGAQMFPLLAARGAAEELAAELALECEAAKTTNEEGEPRAPGPSRPRI